jgi:hypothetical protein
MIHTKLIGMSMISYCKKLISQSATVHELSTQKTMNFNIQTTAMFVFLVFDKNGLLKSCSSFKDLSVYKMSWSHVDWCKVCIHLKSLNV